MLNKYNIAMTNIWEYLKTKEIPIHSLLADYNGTIIFEKYQEPYSSKELHRMFSITKSLCSVAIGYLLADGRLSLDDRISDYFIEYRPSEGFHPWIENMTIRDMLKMETCHSCTTYKINKEIDWVSSFFLVPPTHRSGQIFLYDTSASHTLAALINKLSGKGILEYLKEKISDDHIFSEKSYIIKDPFNSEMGGSGLMSLPSDLLHFGRFCMNTVKKGKGIFADYLREAVSFHVPTVHAGTIPDEQQGYGYHFWSVRGGFAMYGMGGQYVLFYPNADLVIVITSDTQRLSGANRIILDIIYDTLSTSILLKPISTKDEAPLICDFSYKLLNNPNKFSMLSLKCDKSFGYLCLKGIDTIFNIPFSFNEPAISVMDKYRQRIAVLASQPAAYTLFLKIQILDECVGSIHIMLHFYDKHITVWMNKVEENYFNEFSGFLEGILL